MLKSEIMTRPGCFFFPLFITILELLASMRRKEKEIEDIQIEKNFSIICVEKLEEFSKMLQEIKSEFGMV